MFTTVIPQAGRLDALGSVAGGLTRIKDVARAAVVAIDMDWQIIRAVICYFAALGVIAVLAALLSVAHVHW